MTMQKINPDDPETKSANLVEGNLNKLKELFPEAFAEDGIDFEVLKQLLGGEINEKKEKYGLNWHGKNRARHIALTPSTGTLRPCPEESVDWENTQNLMIEGDNLEVLKLLQKSYAGKVKMIYIDPPYNTGKDFVYPDNFRDNIANYLELTGQVDGEGRRIGSNTEASGRLHTDWLNMMYPRLKLARNLLLNDGVICISIDDSEVAHLRDICDEVFGEENFIASIIWQKAYTANQTAKHISNTHDYILICAKHHDQLKLGKFDRTEDQKAKFTNHDNDPRGPWKPENLSAGKFYSAGQFVIKGPTGKTFSPPSGRYWRCNEEQYQEWLNDGRITFGKSGEGRPMLKKFLAEMDGGLTPMTWWPHEESGSNKSASIDLKSLFDGQAVFDTPKPIQLIDRFIQLSTNDDSIVLDFFAGSGVTGHAVLNRNSIDNGNRRFICVQIPEPIISGDYSLLSDVTKERLRRTGKKIKEENPLFAGDTGFKVFKLDSSNIRPWQPERKKLEKNLLDHTEHLLEGRSEQDILYEVLLKLGLDLSVPIEEKSIAGKQVYNIGWGALMVCLSEGITREHAIDLAQGIGAWWHELESEVPVQFVFRDSGFVDDVAKSNLAANLRQAIPPKQMVAIRSL